jgi:hypothetical protein
MTSEQRDPFEDRAVGPASPSIAAFDVIARWPGKVAPAASGAIEH